MRHRPKSLAFQLAALQLNAIGPEEYETLGLRMLFQNRGSYGGAGAGTAPRSVRRITVSNGTVTVLLKNNQTLEGRKRYMNDTAPNVIIIPAKVETPQEQEKKRHLRVAAYCRVSTDSEERLSSYENQLSYYTEKIMKEPGWTMAGVFADEGITGTSTCKRKGVPADDPPVQAGKIDMILAKSVSRFARNTVDTLNFTPELRSLGIPVIFEEQNINSIYPESEFLITLHGAFAQAEREHQQPGALGQASGHEIRPCRHAVQAAAGL